MVWIILMMVLGLNFVEVFFLPDLMNPVHRVHPAQYKRQAVQNHPHAYVSHRRLLDRQVWDISVGLNHPWLPANKKKEKKTINFWHTLMSLQRKWKTSNLNPGKTHRKKFPVKNVGRKTLAKLRKCFSNWTFF